MEKTKKKTMVTYAVVFVLANVLVSFILFSCIDGEPLLNKLAISSFVWFFVASVGGFFDRSSNIKSSIVFFVSVVFLTAVISLFKAIYITGIYYLALVDGFAAFAGIVGGFIIFKTLIFLNRYYPKID